MIPVKEAGIATIQALPDDCTLEEIHKHLYVRAKVERGIQAISEGALITREEAGERVRELLGREPGHLAPEGWDRE